LVLDVVASFVGEVDDVAFEFGLLIYVDTHDARRCSILGELVCSLLLLLLLLVVVFVKDVVFSWLFEAPCILDGALRFNGIGRPFTDMDVDVDPNISAIIELIASSGR
jgi:hypothetical protein